MASVKKWTEIWVKTPTTAGTASKVYGSISEAKVNIWAACAYDWEGKGSWMLCTDDWNKTKDVLTTQGWEVETKEVLVVEATDTVGTGADLTSKLGNAGININYMYGSGTGKTVLLVFGTSDNEKAYNLLK